jgi:sugar phosphate isomerase/epimerase
MRDTIDMAREANLAKYGDGLREGVTTFINALERFEALVRADEREACAKVVEDTPWSNWLKSDCVAAIRARGNT